VKLPLLRTCGLLLPLGLAVLLVAAPSPAPGQKKTKGKVATSAMFEIYKDKGGKYRFRLHDQDASLLANSGKGYEAKKDIDEVIDTIKKSAASAKVYDEDAKAKNAAGFEVYKDKGGKYRFRLKDKAGPLLASAVTGYAARADVQQLIDSIQATAAKAKVAMGKDTANGKDGKKKKGDDKKK
jgi:uncharacterized protein YegP (UPF0339 family)